MTANTANGQGPAKPEPRRLSGVEIEKNAWQLSGKTVLSVVPITFPMAAVGEGVGLIVEFAGGSSLAVVPNPEPEPEGTPDPVADWELFTPFHTYLTVGPGAVWSYLRSDVPAKTA